MQMHKSKAKKNTELLRTGFDALQTSGPAQNYKPCTKYKKLEYTVHAHCIQGSSAGWAQTIHLIVHLVMYMYKLFHTCACISYMYFTHVQNAMHTFLQFIYHAFMHSGTFNEYGHVLLCMQLWHARLLV